MGFTFFFNIKYSICILIIGTYSICKKCTITFNESLHANFQPRLASLHANFQPPLASLQANFQPRLASLSVNLHHHLHANACVCVKGRKFACKLSTPPRKFSRKLSTPPRKFARKLSTSPRKFASKISTPPRTFACKLSAPPRKLHANFQPHVPDYLQIRLHVYLQNYLIIGRK